MSDGLRRHTFEDGRVYTDGETYYPSVSTVLGVKEKAPALKNYLKNTSESEKQSRSFYTQNRGTLIHYHLLSQLTEEEFWSNDEQNSEDCLRGRREHRETGLTGDQETWDRYQEDREWADEQWQLIRRVFGIHPETALGVELFVENADVGYAGQFDLLYTDGDDVVLADIKTSKYVYDKHLLQCVAYKHAVDVVVDRMEVIRINPEQETWKVYQSDDWAESEDELWDEFVSLREQYADDTLEALIEKIDDDGS